MARLEDLPAPTRDRIETLECPTFPETAWVTGPPLEERTVAFVSSAGIHSRGERPFRGGEGGWRPIPHDLPASELVMSHVSVNFDRTGFHQDPEVVLPRRALDALVAEGRVGAAAPCHYSFMGATDPREMESEARALAGRLRLEGVDLAALVPV